ncbi:hypothetical protein [Dyella sp. 2HG41-7]|uniref:hypothetical protein n=1 Tax=Dyella sp. 2HG41-7 TaxID=2883239 RepID=UPI001F1CAB2C|nr:hypothetical protein [Dyella sp. 2HG41-7]
MTVRQIIGEGFALGCALMLGLAAGAIWLVPTVFLHRPLPWLAVPAGWLLAKAMRKWVHTRKWNAAVLAALAVVVASVYIRVLITTVNIAAMLGYGLIDALRTAGASMLLDLARFGVSKQDVVWGVIGIVVAMVTALRSPTATMRKPN